ncbi:AraC family transcriptional regulator [Flagellimonas sp. 389]|uniref:AraC family transcriptional regulator n=1 Tax=Flagellimonas sp. 389 TaxID=2835862 RepID=UPI001BD22CDD|nr:helix-turn-helix domain-containing protein [Flagellimonas sp. 389]MBS9463478.1 AraC family transcriptional regulator [Flagellimonas sp. 389]
MAFRIGKSVMLYFGDDLEPIFIFTGLSFLLIIGPLLRWYILAMTTTDFKLPNFYILELVPFVLIFGISFFISNSWFNEDNGIAVALFASTIIFSYLHLAFYILKSAMMVRKVMNAHPKTHRTKSQISIVHWLQILIVGFSMIWFSYVLNIIEDTVPYIIGPVMYSVVIYYLSYKAYKLNSTHIDGTVFAQNENATLFQRIRELMVAEKLYLESDISLVRLSNIVEKSTQKTSEVINQYAKRNFNDFINYYRIQEAKEMLLDSTSRKYTISSIAFDIGFSSLSSFNIAFKKFEGTTPSSYKKNN